MFKLLVDRQVTVADLRKETGLSSSTFTKLRRDEAVTVSVLLKIADYLDCDIEDLCEFIKTEDLEEDKTTKGMGPKNLKRNIT